MNRKSLLGLMLVPAFVCACMQGGEKEPEPSLTVTTETIRLNADTAPGKTMVVASAAWKASITEGEAWLSASPLSGNAGTTEIVVTPADANENVGERKARIDIVMAGKKASVIVVQPQKNVLLLEGNSAEMSYEGGTLSVTVGTNISYKVKVDVPWIEHLSGTKALNRQAESFQVAENEAAEVREGHIIFSADGLADEVFTVRQAARDPLLQKSGYGGYGLDGKDFIYEPGTGLQLSRQLLKNGNLVMRILNPEALSVFELSGISATVKTGTQATLQVRLLEKGQEVFSRSVRVNILQTDESSVWLKGTETDCGFIMKK